VSFWLGTGRGLGLQRQEARQESELNAFEGTGRLWATI